MQEYFNVSLEFDHDNLHSIIEETISSHGKGFICVVDANVITMAQKDFGYRSVINSALVNTCDGSSIALMAGWIYKKKYKALNGPQLFKTYIEKPYKHLMLGSTEEVLDKVRLFMKSDILNSKHLHTLSLPFVSVEDFDYKGIAKKINNLKPDMIWVSLGAPKQERFMNFILPHINSGVLLGIGAAFKFYIGELTIPRIGFGRLRLIWLSRLFKEPKKLNKRLVSYIVIIPKLFYNEMRIARTVKR